MSAPASVPVNSIDAGDANSMPLPAPVDGITPLEAPKSGAVHPSSSSSSGTKKQASESMRSMFLSSLQKTIGEHARKFSTLEVPTCAPRLYRALIEYAAQRGVDVAAEFPPEATERFKAGNQDSIKRVAKGETGITVPVREFDGEISTLYVSSDEHAIVRRTGPIVAVTYGDDSERDDDDDDDDDDDGIGEGNHGDTAQGAEGTTSLVVGTTAEELRVDGSSVAALNGEVGSGDAAPEDDAEVGEPNKNGKQSVKKKKKKKTKEPRVACVSRFSLGMGDAKVAVGKHSVYLRHYETRMRVSNRVMLAAENPKLLKELCCIAAQWKANVDRMVPKEGTFVLYRFKSTGSGKGAWCREGVKPARPATSIVLKHGMVDAIVGDVKEFLSKETRAWYKKHGLPQRRCYLFHGEPGTGKTSTIRMLAGKFKLSACFLGLTQQDFNNQVLHDALAATPTSALIVIEDVDVLFKENRKAEQNTMLTFSGLLNALDGIVSGEGTLTVMTTNHIERLDKALVRGGRVDRRFEFTHPGPSELADLFRRFYPKAEEVLTKRFVQGVQGRIEEEAKSIATLQQYFIFTRGLSPEKCLDALPKFFEEFYPKRHLDSNPLVS